MKRVLLLLVLVALVVVPASAIIKSCEGIWMCNMNQTPNQTPGVTQDLTDYYKNDTSKALFGGYLHRNVNNDYLSISGGTGGLPYGGNLQLYGGDNVAMSGGVILAVGNDSGVSSEVVFSVLGRTDDPELSMSNNKIIDLKDPTAAQDAATKAYVDLINASAGAIINDSYYLRDNSLPLTTEKVRRDVDNDLLSLYGGDAIAGGTGIISLYGKTNANPYAVEVVGGDAAGVGNLLITGWKDGATPLMDMQGYNITGIKTITVPSDVANKSYVDAAVVGGGTSHNLLLNLTYDDHPQYPNMSGRAGGQTIQGGTTTGDLTLNGSANSGNIFLNPNGGGYVSSGKVSDTQTSLGFQAGVNNTGYTQTAIGPGAGVSNTADYQTAIGVDAGIYNTGIYQTAMGSDAGNGNSGTYETAIGKTAGANNAGDGITVIGASAGAGNTGVGLVGIGYMAGLNNAIPNYFVLRQAFINGNPLISGNFSSGIVRFDNYGAGTLNTDAGGNITPVSDEKLKTSIKPFISNSSKVSDVVTIRYNYNSASGLDTQNVYTGFSAENIQASYPECVFSKDDVVYVQEITKVARSKVADDKSPIEYDDVVTAKEVKTGTQTLSVDQRCLIAVLWNAVVEQQKDIKDLKEWKQDKVRV